MNLSQSMNQSMNMSQNLDSVPAQEQAYNLQILHIYSSDFCCKGQSILVYTLTHYLLLAQGP